LGVQISIGIPLKVFSSGFSTRISAQQALKGQHNIAMDKVHQPETSNTFSPEGTIQKNRQKPAIEQIVLP
jgi:hypothetical protein